VNEATAYLVVLLAGVVGFSAGFLLARRAINTMRALGRARPDGDTEQRDTPAQRAATLRALRRGAPIEDPDAAARVLREHELYNDEARIASAKAFRPVFFAMDAVALVWLVVGVAGGLTVVAVVGALILAWNVVYVLRRRRLRVAVERSVEATRRLHSS